jgi:hypothetical protein
MSGGLPTPLMACTAPLFISAIAVTPASNGTYFSWAGMSLASAGWLSMMLSGLATEPWLTEMVKLGSVVGVDLPPVVAQTTTPTITARTSAAAP